MLRALSVGCFMLTFASTSAAAQMPQTVVCAAQVTPIGEYASWNQAAPLAAGHEADSPAVLTLGAASQISLAPTPDVHYAVRPEKPGGSVSYGGLLALDVASAGTYRIALGSAAWLDVIGKDGPQRSTAHGHGPDCTGIRKMVDFALTPGRYIIQISANGTPSLTVLALAVK